MHRLHSSVWLHFPICYCRSVGLCVDEKPQCRMFHKNMNTNTHTRTHRPVDQFPENSYLQFPFTGTLSRERRYRERICISIPYIRSGVSGFGYINDCNLVRRMPAKRTEMIVVNPQGRPIQLEWDRQLQTRRCELKNHVINVRLANRLDRRHTREWRVEIKRCSWLC